MPEFSASKILIVDDMEANIDVLCEVVGDEFDISPIASVIEFGITFDPRDDTLWVIGSPANYVNHVKGIYKR